MADAQRIATESHQINNLNCTGLLRCEAVYNHPTRGVFQIIEHMEESVALEAFMADDFECRRSSVFPKYVL